MSEVQPTKLKLCLIGESAVGKTSLIRRFVFDQYDDNYICTIGAKVSKKEIKVKHPENGGQLEVQLMIWDIMGHQGFRKLLQQSYFYGAHGIIGVCDVTRENTLTELKGWLEAVQSVTGEVPIVCLGNKCDLEDEQQVGIDELKSFISGYEKAEHYLSSAKTGFNVELAFNTLSEKIVEGKDWLEEEE